MKYVVSFQYMPPDLSRPFDESDLQLESDDPIPIPDVGDTYDCDADGKVVERKVVSRHFHFLDDHIAVNVVGTDVSQEEMLRREKA